MFKIESSIKNNKITIEIEPEWLEQESKNKYWRSTHNVPEVNDPWDCAEYVAEKLNEATIDTGHGEVSPIAYMLMDILETAYEDGEEFMGEMDDEDID